MKNGYVIVGDDKPHTFIPCSSFSAAKSLAEDMSNSTGIIFNICHITVAGYSVPDSQAETTEQAIVAVKDHLAKLNTVENNLLVRVPV